MEVVIQSLGRVHMPRRILHSEFFLKSLDIERILTFNFNL